MAARDEEEFRSKKKKKVKEIDGKWPSVKPKKDLKINRLKSTNLFTENRAIGATISSVSQRIVLTMLQILNFLTAYEAKSFIEVAESIGFTHQGSLGPTKGEAYRDNDRISVIDPFLAESLWESGLKEVFDDIQPNGKAAVGLNPNIRFYRYKVGQKFGRHIDESVDLEQGARTYYTLLVYLSGSISPKGKTNPGNNDSSMQPLAGGETVFYDKKLGVVAEVNPLEGMALLHLHGAKCMLHEARIVTKGIKYVLRSDVAFV